MRAARSAGQQGDRRTSNLNLGCHTVTVERRATPCEGVQCAIDAAKPLGGTAPVWHTTMRRGERGERLT